MSLHVDRDPKVEPSLLRDDVRIDQLTPSHAEAMYRWISEPEIAEGIGLRKQPSLAATREWIDSRLKDCCSEPFAILFRGHHVGTVVLDIIDQYIGTSRLSIYVGETDARGHGIARTAIWLALRFAFDVLNLNKVWLTVHCQNHRAIRLYLGIGFVIEGVHRDEFLLRGRRLPVFYMGMLRSEFLSGLSS